MTLSEPHTFSALEPQHNYINGEYGTHLNINANWVLGSCLGTHIAMFLWINANYLGTHLNMNTDQVRNVHTQFAACALNEAVVNTGRAY